MVYLCDLVVIAALPYTSAGKASIGAGVFMCPNKVYTVFICRPHLSHFYPFTELQWAEKKRLRYYKNILETNPCSHLESCD